MLPLPLPLLETTTVGTTLQRVVQHACSMKLLLAVQIALAYPVQHIVQSAVEPTVQCRRFLKSRFSMCYYSSCIQGSWSVGVGYMRVQ